MLAPRKSGTEERTNVLAIIRHTNACAKIKGKAIPIKDDRELYGNSRVITPPAGGNVSPPPLPYVPPSPASAP